MGHQNVREWIHSENLKFFGRDIKPEQRAAIEALAAPEIGYNSVIELYLGSRRILVRALPGHTGGDSAVVVPDAGVVFCGDLFWRNSLPNLIDATTGKWLVSDEKLAREFPRAIFVPGHGDIGNAADVQEFAGYLRELRSMVAPKLKKGLGGDSLVEAVLPTLREEYGSWSNFDYFSKPNFLDVAAEFRGDKRIPHDSGAVPNRD